VITIVALGIVKTWHEVIRGIRSGSHKELKT
jgi:hypothetical protein